MLIIDCALSLLIVRVNGQVVNAAYALSKHHLVALHAVGKKTITVYEFVYLFTSKYDAFTYIKLKAC